MHAHYLRTTTVRQAKRCRCDDIACPRDDAADQGIAATL
jgi:hypothetical protein